MHNATPDNSALARLLDLQIRETPQHERFLRRRLETVDSDGLKGLNELAEHVSKLIAGLEREHAHDYDWICNVMLEEELHFRRAGRYRLSSFEDAVQQVYSNKELMTHYMRGLLMSQVWWSNHTQSMDFYRTRFLGGNRDGYSHLEIGPGHGLFLYFAAADKRSGDVRGWDISEASIALTADALHKLGLNDLPKLELVDLFKGPTGSFDSMVFSEVLEHMEDPRAALDVLRTLLAPDGRLFINMPINSPAPDHLFNCDSPEDLEAFIAGSGFKVLDRAFFPATNQSLEAARKKKMTISCAFIVGPA